MLELYIHRLSVDEVFVNVVHIGNQPCQANISPILGAFQMVKTCYNDDLFEVVNYFVVKVVKKKLGNGQIRAFYKIRPILFIFRLVVYFFTCYA